MFESKNTHLLYESNDPRLDGMVEESFWFLKANSDGCIIQLGKIKDKKHREAQSENEEKYNWCCEFDYCSKNPELFLPLIEINKQERQLGLQKEYQKLLISIQNMETIL